MNIIPDFAVLRNNGPSALVGRGLLRLWFPAICAIAVALAGQARAQNPSMPEMQMPHQHTHASAQQNQIEFPRLGRDQANAKGELFTV